jgi:hypothetical protein
MKNILSVLTLCMICASVQAEDIVIHNAEYGSGAQDKTYITNAIETYPGSGIYHAPSYMPGYPTAAPIWPRVEDVTCTRNRDGLDCIDYNWQPSMGRGEYLFIRPRIKQAHCACEKPVIIYKEVPVKHGKE